MRPDNPEQARQYVLVARAISFIRDNAKQQPSLEQIAGATHVSPFICKDYLLSGPESHQNGSF